MARFNKTGTSSTATYYRVTFVDIPDSEIPKDREIDLTKGYIHEKGMNWLGEREVSHLKAEYGISRASGVAGYPVTLNASFGVNPDHRCPFKAGTRYYTAIGDTHYSYEVDEYVNSDLTIEHRREVIFEKHVGTHIDDAYYHYSNRDYHEIARVLTVVVIDFNKLNDSSHTIMFDSGGVIFQETNSSKAFTVQTVTATPIGSYHFNNDAALLQLQDASDKAIRLSAIVAPDWSRITTDAVAAMPNLQLTSGLILKDLPELPKVVDSLRDLLRNPLSLKNWAAASLTYQYGVKTTYSDVLTISELIKEKRDAYPKIRFSRARDHSEANYKGQPVTWTRAAKIWYQNNPVFISKFDEWMERWGLYPDLPWLWEAIPLSFAVDWFTNFEEMVKSFDAVGPWEKILPEGGLYSDKTVVVVPVQDIPMLSLGLVGFVVIKRYKRYWRQKPYAPKFQGLKIDVPNTSNLVNGGSLIIQRLK